eukprot:2060535-Rhodomonas_salina.4
MSREGFETCGCACVSCGGIAPGCKARQGRLRPPHARVSAPPTDTAHDESCEVPPGTFRYLQVPSRAKAQAPGSTEKGPGT